MIVDWEAGTARQCDCIARRRVAKVMRNSKIGQAFRDKTFENFSLQGLDPRIVKAWHVAKDYADHYEERRFTDQNGLGIAGAVGSGKTHLLCAVANELLQRGIGVVYFNFVSGMKEMFAAYDRGGQAVQQIREALQTCDVLFIDDLAKGKPNDKTGLPEVRSSAYEEIYTILDYRVFNGLPVLWSSEISTAMIQVLGQATAGRLLQNSVLVDLTYQSGEPVGCMDYRLMNFLGVTQ